MQRSRACSKEHDYPWLKEDRRAVALDRRADGSIGTSSTSPHDTLTWESGPLTLRLEGKLSREQALEIARSFR